MIGVLREGAPRSGRPSRRSRRSPRSPPSSRSRAGRGCALRCTIDVPGDAALPAALGRAAYRIVQEGLTNARKHAPGAAVDVTITAHGGADLVVEVVSRRRRRRRRAGAPAIPGAGTGLIGPGRARRAGRRRARARPRRAGDFVLRATLPWTP